MANRADTAGGWTHAILLALLALVAAPLPGWGAVDESKLPPAATNRIDFLRDIKPILDGNCLKCHGPEKPKSKFRVDSREALLKGGENGTDVVPGQSAKSPLIHFVAWQVEDMEMPPKGKGERLTADQIGLLRAWIDQDLPWSGGAPAEPKFQMDLAPIVGFTTVRGDERKFRELEWQREGWNGGVADFSLHELINGDGGKLTMTGHALRDDYKVRLEVEHPDGTFVRGGFQQFRKYYDDSGGYLPSLNLPVASLGRDLHLDLGDLFVEVGRRTKFGLLIKLGYEYHYKEGDKSTLQWKPTDTAAGPKALLPNDKSIDERLHVLRLDAEYDWRDLRLFDSFRYEFYDLDTSRQIVPAGFPFATSVQRMAEGSQSQTLVNSFRTEFVPRDWMQLSAGYLFTHTDGEDSFKQTSTDAAGAPATGLLWNGQGITLEDAAHIFNANAQLGMWEGMTFSSGLQTEWNRHRSFGTVNLDETDFADPSVIVGNTNFVKGDYDRFTTEERFMLRNVQIPFTVLFGEVRFKQEQIEEIETLSPSGAGFPTVSDFLRNTDAAHDWKHYRAGFDTSPRPRVAFGAYVQRKDHHSDYDHLRDERPLGNSPGAGYPAFITARHTLADEVGTKLTLRPATWLKTTFTFRDMRTDFDTVTDATPSLLGPVPGGKVQAGKYDAHIYGLNVTLTPWRRLYLFSTFTYQDSRTVTEDHGNPSIVPFRGDVYSVLTSAHYALGPLTDLSLSYDFSYANYGQHNDPDGLPLGIDYHRHGIRAGIGHKFWKRFLANLEYVWSYYNEPTSGHDNDFTANGVFATLHMHWQ
jgi:mono/diheme cytochrome c family protein